MLQGLIDLSSIVIRIICIETQKSKTEDSLSRTFAAKQYSNNVKDIDCIYNTVIRKSDM